MKKIETKLFGSEEFKTYIEQEKELYTKYGTPNENGSILFLKKMLKVFVKELKELQRACKK